MKGRCFDCGHNTNLKTVWRKYSDNEKETTVNICLNGCFK